MHAVNWDDLRYVLAISRAGTFSGAAASLGIRHTTASRRLQLFEEQLGVRLFDRTPDGLHPTAAGTDLAELADRMESDVHAAEGRVLGGDVELRGSLRVSTLDTLFSVCHEAFVGFLQRYPTINVTITTPMQSVSLLRREADVALRMVESPDPGLVGRRVGRLEIAVFAAPELVDRVGHGSSYSEFPWLSLDERLEARWLDTWLSRNAPGAQVVARVDENSMLTREMVRRGVGAFFLPTLEGDAMGLCRLGPPLTDYRTDIWLLTLPALQHSSRVRAFMDHMSEELPRLLGEGSQEPKRLRPSGPVDAG